MKLYTRQHFLTALIITVAAVAVITGVITYRITSSTSSPEESSILQEKEEISEKISAMDEADAFLATLQQNPRAETAMQASTASANYTQDELQNISVYEKCNEAVVNISTQVMAYDWFFNAVPQDSGSGSGSIIDKRGYIVTNLHVIENAYKIYVSLSDGSQYEGTVVGTDSASDIAVLKFTPPEGTELSTIPFGSSENLKVGQKVLAIGNPFGFERTLTTGIVSGLGRPIKNEEGTIIRNMIQTDSAINPGNSGGPLLDTQGRMIGINTMIYSTSGSSAGIGFAVSIDTAKRVVADLIQYGKVHRGTINGKLIQLTSQIAEYADLAVSSGLLVSELDSSSNAVKAGLTAGTKAVQYGSRYNYTTIYLGGDVITAVDGTAITSFADYYSLLESKRPGDKVVLTVQRGRKQENLTVILDE
ncbi:MAG: trypsin-like peptidase domain-containing protein [Treponemataceae bacterium]|nr:trypsin-like peptidase domain-containing protein [Treponemataceae bacterium]